MERSTGRLRTDDVLIVQANPGHHIWQALRELWAARTLVVAFAERDVRVKYKQAALGVAWALIQPIALMAIFAATLGRLAHIGGGGVPYAAFTFSALVAWTFFQTSVSFGANAILTDGTLLRKVYFPREIPVLGAIGAGLFDFGVALIAFYLIGPFLGARPSLTWVLAPILILGLALFAAGLACAFGALNAYYRDFRYVLPFVLQLGLFASPVAYPLSAVPSAWRLWYVLLNPAAGLLDSFRRVLAEGVLPDPGNL